MGHIRFCHTAFCGQRLEMFTLKELCVSACNVFRLS